MYIKLSFSSFPQGPAGVNEYYGTDYGHNKGSSEQSCAVLNLY
jgi:hypothetical protein